MLKENSPNFDITKLAAHLGLSVGTVSRALNGRPEVSQQTSKRVANAAKELGYVPNHAGRSLRQGVTHSIGFVINSNSIGCRNAAMLYFDFINGIQIELSRQKIDLIVLTGSSSENMYEYVQRVAQRRIVDGLILAETKPLDERVAYLETTTMPFITFGRSITPGKYSWLDIDFPGMAADGVDRLHAKGHTKIAISVGPTDLYYTKNFMDSYKKRLALYGVPFREDYVFITNGTVEGGVDIAQKIVAMPDPPTAIINLYDVITLGLYRGLYEARRVPGRDLAILGLVNEDVVGPLVPKLSGYSFDPVEIGRKLGLLMVSSIPEYSRKLSAKPENTLFPLQYVQGETEISPPREG